MMQLKSIVNTVLCALFVLILVAPLLIWYFSDDRTISDVEKRYLAQKPSVTSAKALIETFPVQFESYYNDQFGWRESFVHYHNLLKFKMFGTSANDSVIVGKNDWLFFNTNGSFKDYFSGVFIDELHLERYAQILSDRRDWLAAKGIHYLVMPIPNKAQVYPEFLPDRISQYNEFSQYDRVIETLSKNDRFKELVDAKAILLQAKKSAQIYFKTDTHWNENGVAAIYAELVKKLSQWFKTITPLQIASNNIEEEFIGDLTYTLNLQDSIDEKGPKVQWQSPCDITPLIPYDLKMASDLYQNVVETHYPVTNGCPLKNNKALVIHDSFGLYLQPLISQHFGSVIYSSNIEFNGLIPLIDKEKPDVVIDMRVDRNLTSLMQFNPILERDVLTANHSLPKTMLMQIDHDNYQDYLTSSHNLVIESLDKGIKLIAKNEQPHLIWQFEPSTNERPLIMRLELKSEQPTSMVLYYQTQLNEPFSEYKSQTRPIKKGDNLILLRLPSTKSTGKIKLNPGFFKGEFELKSFEVYQQEF